MTPGTVRAAPDGPAALGGSAVLGTQTAGAERTARDNRQSMPISDKGGVAAAHELVGARTRSRRPRGNAGVPPGPGERKRAARRAPRVKRPRPASMSGAEAGTSGSPEPPPFTPPGSMSFRINTNTQAALSLNSLNKTSNEIGMRQLRLATGSRINSAADDSAGYTISKKLESKTRGQAQALSNIGDAKSLMSVAEGSLGSIQDILATMKEKAVQAANDTLGAEERTAIANQLTELAAEIGDITTNTKFNGQSLLDGTGGTSGSFSFQVGDTAAEAFTLDLSAVKSDTTTLGVDALTVDSAANAQTSITAIDTAIGKVSAYASKFGDAQNRLDFKAQNLETSKTNYESANSRIADADFAKEQMQIVKLQILQQTGSAAFAQSNAAPQSVLSFF